MFLRIKARRESSLLLQIQYALGCEIGSGHSNVPFSQPPKPCPMASRFKCLLHSGQFDLSRLRIRSVGQELSVRKRSINRMSTGQGAEESGVIGCEIAMWGVFIAGGIGVVFASIIDVPGAPDVCAAASEVFAASEDEWGGVPAIAVARVPPAGLGFDGPALLVLLVAGLFGGMLGLVEFLGGIVITAVVSQTLKAGEIVESLRRSLGLSQDSRAHNLLNLGNLSA